MTQFVNYTPHAINIYDENNNLVETVKPSGSLIRISVERKKTGSINNIPIFKNRYGTPMLVTDNVESELPSPENDTICIVSGAVSANFPREDFYAPGELLRDENGRPIGCIGLVASK